MQQLKKEYFLDKIYLEFLKQCNLENFESKDIVNLSESIETINKIYTLSTKPDLYNYYADLVKNSYKILCELITEPKVIIPTITEFIIKEGNLKHINIERLNTILTVFNFEESEESKESNKLLIQLLETLRNKELIAYRASLLEEQNKEPTNL